MRRARMGADRRREHYSLSFRYFFRRTKDLKSYEQDHRY
jgi:hypothetical protein